MDEQKLAALFMRLGAPAPAPGRWARSQAQEGIPQLARFLFLRQAWGKVVSPADTQWIADGLQRRPDGPGGGIVKALNTALAAGVSNDDLTEIVRIKQWELLHEICYLLDDPQIEAVEIEDVAWGLFEIDRDGLPGRQIAGLHESVLETDPTGCEMRPRA